jgi:hypothetical protein
MEKKIAGAITFLITAAMADVILAYVEHDAFGLPRHTIRADSLLAACGAAGLLIIALYSARFGKRK